MTKVSQNPSITKLPLANSSVCLQNCLDIVATHGAYLVPRPNTPVFENPHTIHFAIALEQELKGLMTAQNCRRRMYRDAADEWPIRRTPPEVKEKRKAEVKALEELWDITSDDGSEADGLPTPPGSAERSVDISHTRKWRRIRVPST